MNKVEEAYTLARRSVEAVGNLVDLEKRRIGALSIVLIEKDGQYFSGFCTNIEIASLVPLVRSWLANREEELLGVVVN
jgi:hypothetical protein